MPASDLLAQLAPVLALGNADPRLGALFAGIDAGTLDRSAFPSLPVDPRLAVSLVSEAMVRADGHFAVDCALLRGLGLADSRTVLDVALRVDESHGGPLGAQGVREQPFERRSLGWETASSRDSALGLQPGPGGHGDVPGADAVASGLDSPVVRGLQLVVGFKAAQNARASFPGRAVDEAVWRYRPHELFAFDWLLAPLGAPTSGAAVVGKLGGPICAEGAAEGACLLVPTASLREPTLARVDLARDAPPLPPGLIAAGPPIEIVPHVTLARPTPLFLPVDPSLVARALARPDRVRAFHHEGAGGVWEEIPMSMPHGGPPHVRAVVSGFSYFQAAVLDDAPAVGLEQVAALSGQPVQGAYLFDRGASAVTTAAVNDEGRAVGEIVRITPDAGGQLVTSTIVPEACDREIDGPKRGLALVDHSLYFTVERPVWPPEYSLVRWDLSAPDGACAARPFEVLWTSGGRAIGGMAHRPTPAGGELYIASSNELWLLARPPIVAHMILRIPLEPTGDCSRDGAGECAVERAAGGCLPGFNGERGPAQEMLLRIPLDVAVGPLTMAGGGDVVLVADAGNHRVRAINVGTAPMELSGKTIQPGELATIAGNADCHGTSAAVLASCDSTVVDPGDPCAGPLCSRASTTPARDGLPLSQVDLVGPSSIIASKTGLIDPDPSKNGLVIAESCRHQILFADLPLDGSEGLLRPIAGTADTPGDVAGPPTTMR